MTRPPTDTFAQAVVFYLSIGVNIRVIRAPCRLITPHSRATWSVDRLNVALRGGLCLSLPSWNGLDFLISDRLEPRKKRKSDHRPLLVDAV